MEDDDFQRYETFVMANLEYDEDGGVDGSSSSSSGGSLPSDEFQFKLYERAYRKSWNDLNLLQSDKCDEYSRIVLSAQVLPDSTYYLPINPLRRNRRSRELQINENEEDEEGEWFQQQQQWTPASSSVFIRLIFECKNCMGILFEEQDGPSGRLLTPEEYDDAHGMDILFDRGGGGGGSGTEDLFPFCFCTPDAPFSGITPTEFDESMVETVEVLQEQRDFPTILQ